MQQHSHNLQIVGVIKTRSPAGTTYPPLSLNGYVDGEMALGDINLRGMAGERGGEFLHHLREPLRYVLGEKADNKISVLLKEEILSTVAPVVLGVFEMECPVDFDGHLLLLAEKIDLHVAVRPERNVEVPVQRK